MRSRLVVPLLLLVGSLLLAPVVSAGVAIVRKADQQYWPDIDQDNIKKAKGGGVTYYGTDSNDELLGRHGSDELYGRGGSDVLWGDWDPGTQPTTQRDRIEGGGGTDFIYASHGRNTIYGGPGNDAISAHYGYGLIDCGPGRDIYHVPTSRKGKYEVRNCEKVVRQGEKKRGGGLEPLK